MTDKPVSLVTGASRGIGRAIARRLATDGHAVLINYARSSQLAESLAAEIAEGGGVAVAVQGDVCVDGDRKRLVDTALEQFGRLDLLVNNAGITSQGRHDLLHATEDSWDIVFETNLKAPFFLSQRVALAMIDLIKAGTVAAGKIVNISSLSAFTVSTNRADYCMSKAAMGMMTHLFAQRLADEGIQVFEVCPGIIASDMTAPVAEKYDKLIAEGLTPIRRWGQPEDVAAAVAAIAAGAFPFSTGERIHVDGGFHIRNL
jgi:NAD(P)-dependent dehydrogenase (short-subunit alcohol dehydrogenase family)